MTRLYTPPDRWYQRAVRQFVFWLVRIYYPQLEVEGAEKVPADKPVIFVANHPNGLLDPILIMIGLKRQAAFLAMSTLFGNPAGAFLMNAFGVIPIFRHKDDGKRGGPTGDAAERNELTFAKCREILHHKGAMALFPEGQTHSESSLTRFYTGAARIALGSEAESAWLDGATIVPVGLWYEAKYLFRTSALLVVGEPFTLDSYRESYEADERQAARDLTDTIRRKLDEVVLQAENAELLRAVPMVASWVSPHYNKLPLIERHALNDELIETYNYIQTTDPERLEKFSDEARRYAQALSTLGVKDPWKLEIASVTTRRPLRLVLFMILSFPFALLGGIITFIPYQLVRPAAKWFAGPYPSILSTVKLIGGLIFILLGWILTAIGVGFTFGPGWGWALFVLSPMLGYLALIWGESWQEWTTVTSYQWLRLSRNNMVDALNDQRTDLAAEVLTVMQERNMKGNAS